MEAQPGAYAELSWWVTDETRRSLRGRGVFSRVLPRNRFDPEKGQWGALEAALRYSWLDFATRGFDLEPGCQRWRFKNEPISSIASSASGTMGASA